MACTCHWGVIIGVFTYILIYSILSRAERKFLEDVVTGNAVDGERHADRKT